MLIINRTSIFIKWYKRINTQEAVIVNYAINKLKLGYFGDHKRISKSLYELRIHTHGGIRIYYTRQGNEIILLLLGGTKRTQKKDIRKATKLVKELA
jgi:putative addiction module killer protein